MFEEDPLLSFCPGNVVGKGIDLDLLAAWDRVEEVEEGTDCGLKRSALHLWSSEAYILSLAVLAFAVDDVNDLDNVMTCARPSAFLFSIEK